MTNMGPTLYLLFNHTLTPEQYADAQESLGVGAFVEPPEPVRRLWGDIPAGAERISNELGLARGWLMKAEPGDYVLIQGDFGACWLMVEFARSLGLRPIYSTTRREAQEELLEDGSVRLVHRFRHVRFREYGQ